MCAGSHATAVIHFVWPVTFTTLIKDIHMHALQIKPKTERSKEQHAWNLLDVGDPEIIGFVVMTLTFA
jgi:hypothetical protein